MDSLPIELIHVILDNITIGESRAIQSLACSSSRYVNSFNDYARRNGIVLAKNNPDLTTLILSPNTTSISNTTALYIDIEFEGPFHGMFTRRADTLTEWFKFSYGKKTEYAWRKYKTTGGETKCVNSADCKFYYDDSTYCIRRTDTSYDITVAGAIKYYHARCEYHDGVLTVSKILAISFSKISNMQIIELLKRIDEYVARAGATPWMLDNIT